MAELMGKCVCKPRMNHRLELQSATEAQDAYGEPIKTWTTEKKIWAAIEPLNGAERVVALQTEAQITHRIRVRYDAAVQAKKRFKYGTRVFNILPPVNTNEADREMIVSAQETL